MLILCAFSVAFHLTFQNGFAIISNEWNKGLFSAERIWKRIREGKRESGGNPERSGHCKQGMKSEDAIGNALLRRLDFVLICKSGNLLNSLMKASEESTSFSCSIYFDYGIYWFLVPVPLWERAFFCIRRVFWNFPNTLRQSLIYSGNNTRR